MARHPRINAETCHEHGRLCPPGPNGRGGIRTHGTLAGTPVFKTGPINRSGTLPGAVSSSDFRVFGRDFPVFFAPLASRIYGPSQSHEIPRKAPSCAKKSANRAACGVNAAWKACGTRRRCRARVCPRKGLSSGFAQSGKSAKQVVRPGWWVPQALVPPARPELVEVGKPPACVSCRYSLGRATSAASAQVLSRVEGPPIRRWPATTAWRVREPRRHGTLCPRPRSSGNG